MHSKASVRVSWRWLATAATPTWLLQDDLVILHLTQFESNFFRRISNRPRAFAAIDGVPRPKSESGIEESEWHRRRGLSSQSNKQIVGELCWCGRPKSTCGTGLSYPTESELSSLDKGKSTSSGMNENGARGRGMVAAIVDGLAMKIPRQGSSSTSASSTDNQIDSIWPKPSEPSQSWMIGYAVASVSRRDLVVK
jgi:hypothetical protein